MCLWVVSQGHKPIMGRYQLICTGALHTQYIFCTDVPHGGPAFHAAGTEMESYKETGSRAPEDPVLCINDCDFFGSGATMNMCSKCQKDMILLKQEHAKLADASSKDVVRRSSSSDESELALVGAAVTSADLASQISQVKSKEGLKKCTTCHKRVGLTGFSCKCGDLFCAVHHYSDKHNCPFDYRNVGQNAIAKANPIIIAEKLNKI
ncbi:Zinc finger A20 and AN1 domain-containing stress-associated protein 8 [Capsicum annuum]|nr:Zinc finger A20 and AN1 domain-containing stress-associated protein 8 [Capsicum annuum]